MVMGFITVALAGRMAQSILSHRYYDWFYCHFLLIAVPALIMYWIGFIYRIRMYSFTESRFYLMVAGMLMTLFVLMLFWKCTRRYQLMAFLLGAAIILFTYIPGISAKRIGLSCQKQRLCGLTDELKLIDAKTGKLNTRIDMRSITRDSLLCEKYKEVTNVISYVRKETGTVLFNKQYGEWSYSEYDFRYMNPQNPGNEIMYRRINPVNLGEYNILLPEKGYKCDFKNGCVTVRQSDGSVVFEYPIDAVLHQDTMLLHNPEPLFSCRNDSLMLVLDNISINDSVVISKESEPKVLLIQRGNEPYKGCWAFPGGFMNMDETTEQCAIRELEEETGLKVSSLQQIGAYSKVDRDPRGRTVTVAYLARVDAPVAVVAQDDAAKAKWFPLSALPPLAFDHEEIMRDAVLLAKIS